MKKRILSVAFAALLAVMLLPATANAMNQRKANQQIK